MATAHVILAGPLGQPDIGYAPDLDKYLARVQRRLKEDKLEKTLPEGFPSELKSKLVWHGKDLANRYDWTYTLSEEELDEIETALEHWKCKYSSIFELKVTALI